MHITDRPTSPEIFPSAIQAQDKHRLILSAFGLAGISVAVLYDELAIHPRMFAEGPPDFSPDHIGRSVLYFCCTALMFGSWFGARTTRWFTQERSLGRFEWLSLALVFSLATIFGALFITAPSAFNALSLEDGVIEWASASFSFLSCAVLLVAARVAYRRPRSSLRVVTVLVFLAVVFFVFGMEEVSWFQRTLAIDTPQAFQANQQAELNLHNFATDHLENLYYFGAFLFLVAAPFAAIYLPLLTSTPLLLTFMPRPFIAVLGTIACAYNYDMWNIFLTQTAFFGSVVILLGLAWAAERRKPRAMALAALALIVASQWLFLMHGSHFEREWAITEYKEFFIALVVLVWSVDVLRTVAESRPNEGVVGANEKRWRRGDSD